MKRIMNREESGWIDETYGKLLKKMKSQCGRLKTMMPYIPINGKYEDMGEKQISAWTNGFYSGMLWQLYHCTKDEEYRTYARGIEARLSEALYKYIELDHDIGFQFLHTAVANYRITGNLRSREIGLHAANLLAGRFNLEGNYIRAWNSADKAGMAIVDCLMNLPLLHWAKAETDSESYRQIARKHTDMSLEFIIRKDGSCNHVVEFDSVTGKYLGNPGGQGYASGSVWSRGQAWAIYGMALAYRYLNDPCYLDAAKSVAHYFMANVALNDYIPVIDFRAPQEPHYIDTTAGVCAACGMLEIASFVPEYEKILYIKSAISCLMAATKYCNWDPDQDSILSGGSARYDREADREVPIIYGDYFLIEGILRLKDKYFLIW